MVLTAILIFVLICTNSVLCEKKICDLEDSKCLTESANLILGDFILGKKNVEPSDPLHRDFIEANLPKIWIKLANAYLSGMVKCHLELFKIIKELKYECHVKCPHLIIESEYEIKGELGSVFVEGKGTYKGDCYDYNLYFTGDYEKKNKNGKEHIYFKNYKLDLEIGNAHYDFKNLFNGDKEKSDATLKALNEKWNTVDKPTHLCVIKPFMDKYIDNINAYTDIVSVEELFSL